MEVDMDESQVDVESKAKLTSQGWQHFESQR